MEESKESKEFVGTTLEEAKEKAMDYFNSHHIEYEIMPPKFLSMIRGKGSEVRIKAQKKEITEQYTERKKKARQLLDTIISVSELSLTIEESLADGTVRFNLVGDDVKLLTDNKSELLESIQHIIAKAGSSGHSEDTNSNVSIIVDADNFKMEREDSLKNYISRICRTVRKSNQAYILKPLRPSERRIVHIAVQAEGDMTSESIGDGHYKKIKISKMQQGNNNSVRHE
jgi:spoIIIJ-associated protein